jgi:hypothetical protein
MFPSARDLQLLHAWAGDREQLSVADRFVLARPGPARAFKRPQRFPQ